MARPATEPEVRFWKFVEEDPSTGCMNWTGGIGTNGYGLFRHTNKIQGHAHRFSYKSFVGDIAEKMQIDHLCRNRRCVNPWHLSQVTNRENQRRGVGFIAQNIVKTHCSNGHEFDLLNTHFYKGRRVCKECKRIVLRASRARRRVIISQRPV